MEPESQGEQHLMPEAETAVMLASQVMPTIAEHHQKLEEARKDSVQSLRGSVSPTDIFLLDFEPPEL